MRKGFYLLPWLFLVGALYGESWNFQTGLGYEFYGFHAEEGSIQLDSRYYHLGLDLGLTCSLNPDWELQTSLFLGFPLGAELYLNGEKYNEPDLELYDLYAYFISLSAGPSYVLNGRSWSLSLGPVIKANDFVLASRDNDPSYVLSYTLGFGVRSGFRYYREKVTFYADWEGAVSPIQLLIVYRDFSYAAGMGLSLGFVWSLQ